MNKRQEKDLPKETRAEREARVLRERIAQDAKRYREYWLTLDERDRERLPKP